MSAAPGAGLRLAAVVVTHDRIDKLRVTVERLLAEPLDHLLVVDNASSDGTADWLAAQDDPRLAVLRSEVNAGGAGGFEAGLRAAMERFDPDWVLLTDDDGRPEPGALAAFRAADLSGWDGVAAAVRFPDGRICDMNRPVLNPFWHPRVFLRTALGGGRAAFHLAEADFAAPGPVAVDGASFVGLFLSRAAVARAGYPDGKLFIYGDDGLYTLGLTLAGGRIGFFPGVRFEHDCLTFGAASGGGGGRFAPLWKVYYYHRNLLFMYRLAAGWLFWPALAVVLPKWLAKARHHPGARRVFLRLMAAAIRDGLMGRSHRPHAEVRALAGEG